MFIKPAYATCPVCIVGVGGGLLLAKRLGLDDLLAAIWISGFNTAVAFWLAKVIKKPLLNNFLFWSLVLYGVSLLYLWYTKQIGHPNNTFIGIDKIIVGLTVGLIVFLAGVGADKALRLNNQGKVVIYYQKVILPLVFLIITTILFAVLM